MKDSMKVGKPGVNYYALLGVPSTATPEEITKAFRKKILHVHLDKMGPEDDTEICYLTIEAHRILSDKALRAKYDVERSSSKDYKAQEANFVPAGYICYDVGHQQMSRQLLDNITNWTSEYEKCASELSDNYFNCFSQIMAQVMNDDDGVDRKNDKSLPKQQYQQNHFYCPICDKKYVTETQHWDSVINPYMAMFFSDQQGIAALNAYFQGIIGQSMFDWETRYLPTRLLGIWGASEWSMIPKLQQQAANILKQCDYKHESSPSSESESSSNDEPGPSTKSASSTSSSAANVISKLEKMLECSTSRGNNASFASAQNAFLRRSLIQNIIWVVENRDQTVEQMMSRMNELIMQDDIQEIMCLGMAMRNVLKFQSSEWEQLIQDALSQEQFELAMLWTMLAIESGDKSKSDWFQLGMTIRGMGDAVLAHFCFLLSGCEETDAWEDLADLFTQNGAHYAAIEYILNKGNLFQLLEKSTELKKVDAESAAIYSGIFYATRVKGLLQVLRKRSRQCFSDGCAKDDNYDAEMEEMIDLIQELGGNTLEGFRIIVSTWPDVFEDSLGQWIHRASIQYLRKGAINLKSQKLILAAIHYLPEDEQCEEICTMTGEACQLTRSMLERAQETNDFEMLTDVLLHLNKRTLSTAEEYLNEIRPPPPPPPVQETNEEEMTGENEENAEAQEPEPAPLPQPPEPSHKSAIYLLLSGTIHKVHENWLDAMKDYQNALLSAPEVMHRVLPCVSKLVQDIQFHEAVVAQVQHEIEELQESLLKKEYPNVDEFSSDKRRSLILTDVTPKMDYGYKDSVAKIQPDPEKMPPPPPPDEEPMDAPPPPPANTPMVTLDRNQEAINSGQLDGQMDQLSAALAYVDLLKALPLQMHPGPIVMAASHFLRAMDDNSKPEEMGKLYAYRNAIMLMAENLLRVDKKLQHTIHHGLTHKHMLSILLSAHEKLSKALQLAKKNGNNIHNCKENESSVPTPDDDDDDADNDKVNTNHEAEDNNNCTSPNKKDLIRKSEAHVISKFFQNVVNFPKVEPLASIPTLNCSDLVYVETLGNSFLSQFCADKVRQKHQSPMIPKHLHAYSLFVEVWKGRSTLSDFPQARVKAMEELLALNGWTMANVQSKMMWPFLSLSDGFSPTRESILQLREPFRSYRTIDGFHINYETGSVELIMSRDPCFPVDTLFDWHDIIDVVSLSKAGLDKLVFSLETPDGGSLNSHPFKEARFTVAGQSKANTPQQQQKIVSQIPEFIMGTLSRVSMLLCYLASGLEICSETPFWMRRTDEGLLARLDEHLQHLARPISWRKAEQRESNEKSHLETETMGKFWLNMIEVFEEIEEDEEEAGHDDPLPIVQSRELTYRVGEMRTEIRPNTLVILDPKRGKQKLSPEAEFCRDLTRHFKEFSRAFPELQRLEELVKLSIVCSKLRQVLKENKALIQEFQSKSHPSSSSDKESSKLKAVQRVCSVIESFLTLQNPQKQNSFPTSSTGNNNCNWLPAIFCHNMDPDVYDVTAVLDLDPVVTYGPVPSSPKPIKVPLERIIEMGGGRQVAPIEIDAVIEKAVIDVDQQKIKNTKDDKVEKEVEQESDENEEEEEVSEEQEECVNRENENDEDGVSVNDRMLSAVPEESEDDDGEMEDEEEVEEEEICKEESVGVEMAGSDEEISEYENEESEMDQHISVEEEASIDDDEEDEVAVADESIDSENEEESDLVSEIDDDDGGDHEATNEKMDHVDDGEHECSESEEEEQKDVIESVVVEEEEEVPTLTIKLKRSSIVSQTDEENNNDGDVNKVEMHQEGSNDEILDSEEEDEEFSENEDEKEGKIINMPQQDDVSSEIVTDDNDVEEEESESLEEQDEDEDKNKIDYEMDENKMQCTGAFKENGKIKNSLNSNGESNNDEDEEDEESEILSENIMECDADEGSVSENEGIENEDECKKVDTANGESTEEEESYSEIQSNGSEDKSEDSPTKNSDPVTLCKAIEGKCATKLKKSSESLESSNALQNVTKRSFLTRRGRLMTKANSENVMGNIVSDSEKTENESEEGDLFIPEK